MEVLRHSLNPCHQHMAYPQLAGAGDGLHLCRVAANILNKQSRAENKGWSSNLDVGRRPNSPHTEKLKKIGIIHKSRGLGLIF